LRFLRFFRVTASSMNERFAQHADAGFWHQQTKFIGGRWEWEIFEKLRGKIASGHARTMERQRRPWSLALAERRMANGETSAPTSQPYLEPVGKRRRAAKLHAVGAGWDPIKPTRAYHDEVWVVTEELDPTSLHRACSDKGGPVAGGTHCRLLGYCRAALPLRKPHMKRTSTDTA
jgi:hypothetical protein